MKMKKRIISIVLLPLFALAGCGDWLDVVPENDITTVDTDFETRDEAYEWLKSCYSFLQDPLASKYLNEAFTGSDEVVYSSYLYSTALNAADGNFPGCYIATGLQNSLDPYADYWSKKELSDDYTARSDYYTAITLCNIFIDKIDQVYNMEDREKAEWKTEVMAVKAYYYFELIRHYGPIILVEENIDPNASVEEMKQPRAHVDSCFAAIVRLCDQAAAILPPFNQKETNRRTYFNKEAALALKARALLYAASPLFNGNPDYSTFVNKNGEPLFNPDVDKEKWRLAAEAAEEAIQACLEGGKHLVDDQSSTTDLLTHMRNIEASVQTFNYESDEVLWMIRNNGNADIWSFTLPKLASDNLSTLAGTQLSPSMKMVEMFYTANGLPIDQDPSYNSGNLYALTRETDLAYSEVVASNQDVLVLHTKREPRFYANIGADRCYWRLGRTVDDNYLIEAYQGEEWGLKARRLTSTVPENLSGYWIRKWTCSDANLSTYSSDIQAMGEEPFPVFRMAELYLIAAEAWNEYLDAPDDRVYDNLDEVRERAGIPDVRTSWAMARERNKVNTQAGMRDIIQQEWNIEFAFEGYRFWNLRRWKTAPTEMNEALYGWNVTGSTAASFYNNFQGPVVVKSDLRFVAPRDYFWPIRSEEVLTSGCVQNPGW